MLSKTSVGVAAAAGGLCFLGYCIYFDRKRRSDPDFKKKLRERRKRAAENEQQRSGSKMKLPDLSSPEAMQRFFLQEIQIGEDLLAQGEIEEGVEHLSVAVAVCGQPSNLLQVLQQTLPPQVFQLLVQKLPSVSERLNVGSKGPTIKNLEEDDVE